MADRTGSDIIADLQGEPPSRSAGDMLDPSKMKAEGARQERQQQRDDALRNADGSPIKLSGGR